MLNQRILAVFTALIFVYIFPKEAISKYCNLSGKKISYTLNYCWERKRNCKQHSSQLTIVGDKVLAHKEGKNRGIVYYIGRRVKTNIDINRPPIAPRNKRLKSVYKEHYVTAKYNFGQLELISEAGYFTRMTNRLVGIKTIFASFSIVGCERCQLTRHYISWIPQGRNKSIPDKTILLKQFCNISEFR